MLVVSTRYLVLEISVFYLFGGSAFWGTNSSPTEIFTSRWTVESCVQYFSTHFSREYQILLESFHLKVQETAIYGNNLVKIGSKGCFSVKSAIFRKIWFCGVYNPLWSLTPCQFVRKNLERF